MKTIYGVVGQVIGVNGEKARLDQLEGLNLPYLPRCLLSFFSGGRCDL